MARARSSADRLLSLSTIERQAKSRSLCVSAGLNATRCAERSDLPSGTRTLLLLSPDEPAFWPGFVQSPEYRGGAADPMDRWSKRVISDWAATLGAVPLFPFGGPPFQPFIDWALSSGRVHSSPSGMIVHPDAGLYLSFRGALALREEVDVPADCSHPCNNCVTQPCLMACPVEAFSSGSYDVPRCKGHLATPEGSVCMSKGCAIRRACPHGKSYGRIKEHSSFHMSYFL